MQTIKIKGMSCQHCVKSVTNALQEIDGMSDVKVDLTKGEATYSQKTPVSLQTIKNAVSGIGFEVVE